jgi:chaperonin GroEL (HSP60 family)
MTDHDDLTSRLEALAHLVEAGYEIPAAGRAMREAAAAIRALVAERDECRYWDGEQRARAEIAEAEDERTRAALGERFTLVPPDGGDVKTHEAAAAAIAALAKAEAERDAAHALLREARDYIDPYSGSAWENDGIVARIDALLADPAAIRRAALEEAARVAEALDPEKPTNYLHRREGIPAAIRALADKEPTDGR